MVINQRGQFHSAQCLTSQKSFLKRNTCTSFCCFFNVKRCDFVFHVGGMCIFHGKLNVVVIFDITLSP